MQVRQLTQLTLRVGLGLPAVGGEGPGERGVKDLDAIIVFQLLAKARSTVGSRCVCDVSVSYIYPKRDSWDCGLPIKQGGLGGQYI